MSVLFIVLALVILSGAGGIAYYLIGVANKIESSVQQIELKHQAKVDGLLEEIARKEIDIKSLTEAVEISAHSVEKIHQSIADTSFEIISTVKPVKTPTKVIQQAHNITAKEVYSSIRKVNRLVGGLTDVLSDKDKDKKKKR